MTDDAILIHCQMVVTMTFEVSQNFNLTGSIKEVDMQVTKVQTFFWSDVDTDTVNVGIKTFQDPLRKALNSKLKKGVSLPIPDTIKADISESDLIQFDHYILIQANPNFHKKIQEQFLDSPLKE